MKNSILILSLLLTAFGFSQKVDKLDRVIDFNRLSVELNVGNNKPNDNFSEGYFTADDATYLNFNKFSHYNLGVRYMFNEKFGIKIDGSYDEFKPESKNVLQGSSSLDFESKQYRIGFQGVLNMRNLLNFDSFSGRLGLLAHAGIQVSRFDPITRNGVSLESINEDNGGVVFGLTPQFRITNRLVLNGDFTFIQNTRQHLLWDGERASSSTNLRSSMVNTSVGITFYLGKQDVHADFYQRIQTKSATSDSDDRESLLAYLNERFDKKQDLLVDSDGDGVIDMFDLEPNTPPNTLVDTRGRTLILPEASSGSRTNIFNIVEQNDLGNIFFDLNVSTPQESSANRLFRLIQILKEDTSINVRLLGYADNRGSGNFNQALSERRANNVSDILTKNGIDPSRILEVSGGGIDTEVYQDSEVSFQMARRVSVILE